MTTTTGPLKALTVRQPWAWANNTCGQRILRIAAFKNIIYEYPLPSAMGRRASVLVFKGLLEIVEGRRISKRRISNVG
jgi:hypothetical protein